MRFLNEQLAAFNGNSIILKIFCFQWEPLVSVIICKWVRNSKYYHIAKYSNITVHIFSVVTAWWIQSYWINGLQYKLPSHWFLCITCLNIHCTIRAERKHDILLFMLEESWHESWHAMIRQCFPEDIFKQIEGSSLISQSSCRNSCRI